MNKQTYFQVRGQRAIFHEREDNGKPVRTGTTPDQHLRYEALFQRDAEGFATEVFKREQIICTIDEVFR